MANIRIDHSKITGPMRPLHGVCNGPISGTDNSLFRYLGEAGIPYSRLHDTGGNFGGHVFVDIENIFRNFEADADDPAAYDFAFTDWLIAELDRQGAQPFYRLGATIENSQHIRPYHILPPKDPLKWAEICAHIIAHYNEGWADGFRYGIEYWEIWNEPDNTPDVRDNPMWKGTMEQFFELYEVTANLLKARFPSIKVGGYASCGFYAVIRDGDRFSKAANVSPRFQYFIDFAEAFFDWITREDHRAPLDFFSWHSYADAESNIRFAEYARELLDSYGFSGTESILNEWNPGTANRGTLSDAALIAGMMCTMHARSDVHMMNYYDGQVHGRYCGMFDPVHFVPFKAYYAFPAFNALYRLGHAVQIDSDKALLRALAASDGRKIALLLANTSGRAEMCAIEGIPAKSLTLKLIDRRHDLEEAACLPVAEGSVSLRLGAYNVALLEGTL